MPRASRVQVIMCVLSSSTTLALLAMAVERAQISSVVRAAGTVDFRAPRARSFASSSVNKEDEGKWDRWRAGKKRIAVALGSFFSPSLSLAGGKRARMKRRLQ